MVSTVTAESTNTTTKQEEEEEAGGGVDEGTATADFGSLVTIKSEHPILRHKISILRSSSTLPAGFRAVLREVTYHLGYEATRHLQTRPIQISVPSSTAADSTLLETTGSKLADRVALIPILRSGLGMTEAMLELLPMAGIHHVGMYKRGGTNMPVQYYNRLPRNCNANWAFILDPVIATSETMMSVIGILKKWGVPKIGVVSVLASRQGLLALAEAHPDVHITVGTVDETLTDGGDILPGLGDAGDRIYGTQQEDDEALLHPSKRKRTNSIVAEEEEG